MGAIEDLIDLAVEAADRCASEDWLALLGVAAQPGIDPALHEALEWLGAGATADEARAAVQMTASARRAREDLTLTLVLTAIDLLAVGTSPAQVQRRLARLAGLET